MSAGTIENIGTENVLIRSLGWLLPPNTPESFDDVSGEILSKQDVIDEIVNLVNSSDLVVKDNQPTPQVIPAINVPGFLQGAIKNYTIDVEGWVTSQQTTSSVWLEDSRGITHDVLPIYAIQRVRLRAIVVLSDIAETTDEYAIQLHSNPHTMPQLIDKLVTLYPTSTIGAIPDKGLDLNAGYYGLSLDRITGNGPSTFTKVRVTLFAEPLYY